MNELCSCTGAHKIRDGHCVNCRRPLRLSAVTIDDGAPKSTPLWLLDVDDVVRVEGERGNGAEYEMFITITGMPTDLVAIGRTNSGAVVRIDDYGDGDVKVAGRFRTSRRTYLKFGSIFKIGRV